MDWPAVPSRDTLARFYVARVMAVSILVGVVLAFDQNACPLPPLFLPDTLTFRCPRFAQTRMGTQGIDSLESAPA